MNGTFIMMFVSTVILIFGVYMLIKTSKNHEIKYEH